jgi:hypothetical protein
MISGDIIHIQFHPDRFRPSNNVTVLTSEISEAAVLILWMGENYNIHC